MRESLEKYSSIIPLNPDQRQTKKEEEKEAEIMGFILIQFSVPKNRIFMALRAENKFIEPFFSFEVSLGKLDFDIVK